MQVNLTLIQRSAPETHQENLTLASLAKQGRKDSETLKTLTLIATMYLPATLVATVFSSSLIQWKPDGTANGDGKELLYTVAPQFWIYVVSTVALMILTLACASVLQKGIRIPWIRPSPFRPTSQP